MKYQYVYIHLRRYGEDPFMKLYNQIGEKGWDIFHLAKDNASCLAKREVNDSYVVTEDEWMVNIEDLPFFE